MEVHHQRRPLRASIHSWRPFSPDSHGAHGHWALNARNALYSGCTGERGGGQHPATSGRSVPARDLGRGEPLKDRFRATSLGLSSAPLGQFRSSTLSRSPRARAGSRSTADVRGRSIARSEISMAVQRDLAHASGRRRLVESLQLAITSRHFRPTRSNRKKRADDQHRGGGQAAGLPRAVAREGSDGGDHLGPSQDAYLRAGRICGRPWLHSGGRVERGP
jgi:hypothetical protein